MSMYEKGEGRGERGEGRGRMGEGRGEGEGEGERGRGRGGREKGGVEGGGGGLLTKGLLVKRKLVAPAEAIVAEGFACTTSSPMTCPQDPLHTQIYKFREEK